MLLFFNFGLIFEKTRSFQLCVGTSFEGNAPIITSESCEQISSYGHGVLYAAGKLTELLGVARRGDSR